MCREAKRPLQQFLMELSGRKKALGYERCPDPKLSHSAEPSKRLLLPEVLN